MEKSRSEGFFKKKSLPSIEEIMTKHKTVRRKPREKKTPATKEAKALSGVGVVTETKFSWCTNNQWRRHRFILRIQRASLLFFLWGTKQNERKLTESSRAGRKGFWAGRQICCTSWPVRQVCCFGKEITTAARIIMVLGIIMVLNSVGVNDIFGSYATKWTNASKMFRIPGRCI